MADIIGIKEAEKITLLSGRALRALCERGEIPGAVKAANAWVIPREWADARRAENYSATHMSLSEAVELSGLSRSGMLDKLVSGEVKGFAQPLLQRNRWWVERDSFMRWLEGRRGCHPTKTRTFC